MLGDWVIVFGYIIVLIPNPNLVARFITSAAQEEVDQIEEAKKTQNPVIIVEMPLVQIAGNPTIFPMAFGSHVNNAHYNTSDKVGNGHSQGEECHGDAPHALRKLRVVELDLPDRVQRLA